MPVKAKTDQRVVKWKGMTRSIELNLDMLWLTPRKVYM